ncbi:hypothetical protein AMECASPLE_002007 [Ameca splendens]|uniref:Uncharacterized protein n=1 Tax=Ameca splendens TaxID=208324 RepID=A0ABV0Z8B3_9TELE
MSTSGLLRIVQYKSLGSSPASLYLAPKSNIRGSPEVFFEQYFSTFYLDFSSFVTFFSQLSDHFKRIALFYLLKVLTFDLGVSEVIKKPLELKE